MTNFFSKLFGGEKKKETFEGDTITIIKCIMQDLIEKGGFELEYEIFSESDFDIHIELSGADEELIKSRDGQFLDALQLFLQRALQHRLPDDNVNISVDCDGFREEVNQALMDLADKLKGIALNKGKSVYIRALPPKDRKVIHQYLAEDGQVKSRSVGDGHYKKIKIYPAKEVSKKLETMPDSVI